MVFDIRQDKKAVLGVYSRAGDKECSSLGTWDQKL